VARLDRFIQAVVDNRAQALLLVAGKPASLLLDGAARPVSRDPLGLPQISALLREICPPPEQGALDNGGSVTFTYGGPTGAVKVEFVADGAAPQATLTPQKIAEAAPQSAEGGPPGPPPSNAGPGGPASAGRASVATPVRDYAAARALLDHLLRLTVQMKSSDLHLRTGEQPILRRDGELVRQEGSALEADALDDMLVSIMAPQDLALFRETGDADWAYEVPGVARFRCNAAQERRGPMGVFRVIPSKILTAEELGLAPEIQKLCYLSKGLVLVTGPTGSGKSTTLAAMVDLMNRNRSDHILTIEDPIEFVHPPKKCVVTQRQVGQHSRSFKAALRAALREDPDVILVGEMRDLETVAIAIETAETGHLVFGTLHTTTAASTIDRIIDQFPADRQSQVRVMLAESLKGVVAQVLCRKVGGGRVAAKEVLLTIPAISNLIREGKTFQIPSIMQTNRKTGMVMLNDALLELVEQKVVEPREAYLKAAEKASFASALKARRIDTSFLSEG
jgi:twitching motility protein PilT